MSDRSIKYYTHAPPPVYAPCVKVTSLLATPPPLSLSLFLSHAHGTTHTRTTFFVTRRIRIYWFFFSYRPRVNKHYEVFTSDFFVFKGKFIRSSDSSSVGHESSRRRTSARARCMYILVAACATHVVIILSLRLINASTADTVFVYDLFFHAYTYLHIRRIR